MTRIRSNFPVSNQKQPQQISGCHQQGSVVTAIPKYHRSQYRQSCAPQKGNGSLPEIRPANLHSLLEKAAQNLPAIQNALRQLVDTSIFTTNGFTGMKDPALLRLLRQAAETTGLIILTDSDGAGFLIRNTLKSALPAEGVLHAYIPDIPGKERRKTAPGKEGLLGVEGMRPEILLQALRNAGADFEDAQAAPAREPVTKQDFFTLGLSGRPDSAAKRAALLQALSLPAHMSANALLQAVNVLFSREEFLARFVEP